MKKIASILSAALLTMSLFAGCGASTPQETAPSPSLPPEAAAAPAATAAPTPSPEPVPESSPAPANVATAEDMTAVEEVVEEGMVPVYAGSLREGVYPVTMKSSSSMFKADHCELRVEGGAMTARLYMTSAAYGWMYAGTALEAASAAEDALLPLTEGEAGNYFDLPLGALDEGEPFAAYSFRKELWYDRSLLFRADSLPPEAFAEGFFTTAESLGLSDGNYAAEVTLSGGSGKATVDTPAPLTVRDGKCSAVIAWSSPNYDYMRVGEEMFLPINTEGNSIFEIPVAYFDRPLTVYADTTAMSQPHEIEYTLLFDSASIVEAMG